MQHTSGDPVKAEDDTEWLAGEDIDNHPIATFTFKYRSRAALERLGVLPQLETPSQEPALEDVDPAP